MSNYIKKFDNYNQYKTYITGSQRKFPNVSLADKVRYNPGAVFNANGYEYVDLGLPSGILWAKCNVGANSETESGNYYAWGETGIKDSYSGANYTLGRYNGSTAISFNRYNETDNLKELNLEDDAAHINMGGDWMMPTVSDCNELLSNTTQTSITTAGGVNGILFTSTVNNNTLFIPAGGYYNETSFNSSGILVECWTASLDPAAFNGETAFELMVNNNNVSTLPTRRYYGIPVRGIIFPDIVTDLDDNGYVDPALK